MQMKGIDVSSYQGDIDFKKVKESGMDFVIIKAGEWNSTREDFERYCQAFEKYYTDAKAAGLYVGAYWFCDGMTLDEIKSEADTCLSVIEGKQFEFPVYMDLERGYQLNLGKEFCSDAVRTFCDKLEKAGYFTGLYTAASWLDSVIDDDVKKRYTIWVADWRGYCGYKGKYGMWQYGKGEVPGIYGATDFNVIEIGGNADYPASSTTKGVDLDYAYEDFPTEIISNGLNNYPAPVNKEENWKNDPCRNVSDTLDIKGVTPILSGDTWFLIDKSCSFTLETLPYAKVNVYLVGGGEDGAEWVKQEKNGRIFYKAANKSRGGCVLQKQIYITGNVECKAFIAKANEPLGTSLKIGNDIYKCNDEGYIWRKAAASAGTGIFCNAESGANGLKTPYGYVGSSGGGGGTYNQGIEAFAGKGGAGAGDGGAVKQDGLDAVNYGCGGGAAGFGGFPSAENTVETHGGHGMGGCIIFEILDGGACDGSSNKPTAENNSGGCFCECPHHEFTCPEPSETSSCERETNYMLTYDGDTPVETENTTSNSSGGDGGTSADNSEITNNTSNSASGCGSSNSNHGSSCGNSSGNCKSGCGCGTGNSKCFSYNVQKWGENWLLFDKSGDYSLTMDSDVVFTAYLAGGGSDGENGIYYNKTAYGGNGGSGGSVAIIRDIKVSAGELDITVMIGSAGDSNGTSVIINNNEYTCNDSGCETNDGGFQGISGKHGHKNAGNGSNGIETPFGYIGSSGGGGAAYCNNSNSGYGKGGLNAGNGGKIVNGKSTPGDKATGYGCGGGGGAASSVSWCKGGKGKQGCVILTWE